MKTRIISGVVMAAILAAMLAVGFLWNTIVIAIVLAILAALAIFELLHNAVGITDKFSLMGACVYSFALVMTLPLSKGIISAGLICVLAISIIYGLFAVFMILRKHGEFDIAKIAAIYGLPLPFSFAFFCLGGIIMRDGGIYYLLLLLNFSSVCDMGAYFAGSFLGKHKLCPNISPKKTVEGAVGGVAASLVVTLILALCFSKPLLNALVLTIPFCIIGMVGDLFASAIKRSVGLKDYSHLIPGHGGILDRVDSIIMIAPLMYFLVNTTVL